MRTLTLVFILASAFLAFYVSRADASTVAPVASTVAPVAADLAPVDLASAPDSLAAVAPAAHPAARHTGVTRTAAAVAAPIMVWTCSGPRALQSDEVATVRVCDWKVSK
jgi:hypothetical protein